MNARALVLIAMLVGLFLLMAALIRWGESYRLTHAYDQKLAQREGASRESGRFLRASLPGGQTTPRVLNTLPPTPFSPPRSLAQVQTPPHLASKMGIYLSTVLSVEQARQRTWKAWWKYLAPPDSPQALEATPPPLTPIDLFSTAAAWDKPFSKSLPDSECLPFHVAYLRYLALEKDYARRLTLLDQAGERAALLQLQTEMQTTLVEAATQVQAKLRTLQHDHPEFSPELQHLTISAYTQ